MFVNVRDRDIAGFVIESALGSWVDKLCTSYLVKRVH